MSLAASAGGAAAGPAPATRARTAVRDARPPLAMKLGCQSRPTSDAMLDFFKRHSVNNICGAPTESRHPTIYSVDELARTRERCEKHGVSLDMLWPPFLASDHIDRAKHPSLM